MAKPVPDLPVPAISFRGGEIMHKDDLMLIAMGLTPKQVLYLNFARDGYRVKDIAEKCGVRPSTVSKVLSDAVKKLRVYYGQEVTYHDLEKTLSGNE